MEVIAPLLAVLLQAADPHCSFAHPPSWPSFVFVAMNREGLSHMGDTNMTPPKEGVIVLGWVGTSMPGDESIHVWVYTRPDHSIVSSRLLHADAMERLYGEVESWLKEHQQEKPDKESPDVRVSR